MIDIRHETFLALCSIGNYTKTASHLHITQPAVSQHIKYLEQVYKGRLVYREGKTLRLTERGKILHSFVRTLYADTVHFKAALEGIDSQQRNVSFGATLSIGEYIMPDILRSLMERFDNVEFHMQVENTQTLLEKLKSGEISFACIEGFFDKSQYEWRLLSEEDFIPVCSNSSPLQNKTLYIEDLLSQRLIIREKGSGTREIFEQILNQKNLRFESFEKICEVGNMQAIKKLVQHNQGITFLYKAAAEKELKEGTLVHLKIKNLSIIRAFHFVWLKNSMHNDEYLSWFNRILYARDKDANST